MREESSFEREMEDEPLSDKAEGELLCRHIEGYKNELNELRNCSDEGKRYFNMPRAALAAYMLEEYDEAKKLALEMMAIPKEYSGTWNDGNLIYYSNWILGMLELDSGNLQNAKGFLLDSGACGGSPQLNSFGPNMRLAKRILIAGDKDAVLEFFNLISGFWKNGSAWITVWRERIDENKVPNCLMHIF